MSPKFGKNKKDPKDPKDPQGDSTPTAAPVDGTQATPDAHPVDTSQAPAAPGTHPDPAAPGSGRVTAPPVSREPTAGQVTEPPASPGAQPGQVTEPPVSREPEPVPVPATPEEAIRAFIDGRHQQPHDLLGHHLEPEGLVVRAFRPFAASVVVRFADGEHVAMEHESDGVWRGLRPGATQTQDYRLLVAYGDGIEHVQDDPYRFAPTLGDLDRYLIGEGRHEQLWTVLGAHVREYGGPMGSVVGTSFAVWAPRAQAVHVVGDFNGWDTRSHPMRLLGESGVWELFVPGVGDGALYKFMVRGADGRVREKADPMARSTELPPGRASRVEHSRYDWQDEDWLRHRTENDPHTGPMSVYEVHLGSWRKGQSYRDLAEHLVNYTRDLGFTHVEFMPVMEHPYPPSWGYHVTSYYAPSARFGTPDDFRYLVDRLHRAGIGVILDWVPGHFATDPWALAQFDGLPLYEHPDPRKGWHPEWGSYIFDFGRQQVRNFLVANAVYWLEEFHVDGLRVDGVASMLYLDYARRDGEWIPNVHGGRENLEAVGLLQEANATAYKRVPGIVTIAEESTSWPGVTKPTDAGGLGFGLKWNMGWMNDSLRYLKEDPVHRQYHHNLLTFSLMYAYSENYLLPISHDEVVHGKGSLLRKVPGSRYDQLATVRAYLAYIWSHPGKQLIFMGSEFAQEAEWADGRELDWWLLDHAAHYRVHNLVKELNRVYKDSRALWALDSDSAGFEWLNANDNAGNTYSYLRFGTPDRQGDVLAVAVNFGGISRDPLRLGVPRAGRWRVVLDTSGFDEFGTASQAGVELEAQDVPADGQPYSVEVTVAKLSAVYLAPIEEDEEVAAP
ncbi:1,4-alpha-glucan branching protein GlgB [Phycicoccus sp. 3266]|uniref:1,4-alpha-glucan branching protein GlgB n=1 Tax=Phycicoccus sp. 3266 TaxID=2817751 RepID=UPI0028546F48|nr:1,4-alpha-glucan branching protein GlgB [Phycicoccus sp. 3266]MDR6862127.1 1,4-alpha-glucan branching enzyme [Phycicoccus sp. 3266]